MTDGTWNLYLLAVHPQHHGQGLSVAMVRHVEQDLLAADARVLLIETQACRNSLARERSTPDSATTRKTAFASSTRRATTTSLLEAVAARRAIASPRAADFHLTDRRAGCRGGVKPGLTSADEDFGAAARQPPHDTSGIRQLRTSCRRASATQARLVGYSSRSLRRMRERCSRSVALESIDGEVSSSALL